MSAAGKASSLRILTIISIPAATAGGDIIPAWHLVGSVSKCREAEGSVDDRREVEVDTEGFAESVQK